MGWQRKVGRSKEMKEGNGSLLDYEGSGSLLEYGRSAPLSETCQLSPVVVEGQEEEGRGLWEVGGVLRSLEVRGSQEPDKLVHHASCNISPAIS